MTWIMLQSLFLPLSVVLMMSLYKSRRRFMTRFYEAMARNGKARKLYVQLLLVLLLLFHYAYANGHPGEFGIVLSTIICAAMFSTKRTDKWLRWLSDRPRRYVASALMALVFGFVPHLYTVAVTIAFILLGALFYPSEGALTEREEGKEKSGKAEHPGTSADTPYDNHHAGLPNNADNGNPNESAQ